jgi:ketosteroid isomerase-like protein
MMRSLRVISVTAFVLGSCAFLLSCASAPSLDAASSRDEENTRFIRQLYENFLAGDIQSVLRKFSLDVDWDQPRMENVPIGGRLRGRDQVAQFFTRLGEVQEVLEFEPRQFIAQGDKVVALGHYRWRVKPTGKRFEGDWAHVFTIRDGQIVSFKEYLDTAAVVNAYRP